ncbi:MAG: DUF3784 domain-containing protein [Bacillota bacterium]|nr:DUF3784 domain-containing protein [Bacillota bacterium]
MIFLSIAVLIFIIGVFVKYKKVTWLISGYNTASNEKKAEYDIAKLTKYFGNFLFVLAGSFSMWGIVWLILPQYSDFILWCGFCSAFVIIVAGIFFLNTGDRVKKN